MVASNHFLAGKFKATVINDIWPEMIFFTAVATMVSAVSKETSQSLAISNQMLTVLGTVLGLVISFRTSSAYERYWEGRKLWTSINLASRNLAHLIWIHVPNERVNNSNKTGDDDSSQEIDIKDKQMFLRAVIEKKSMISLVQAFSVAVKHMLRGEPGIYYEDLYPLVCFLPRYASDLDEQHDTLPLWEDARSRAVPSGDTTLRRNSSAPADGRVRREKTFDPEQVLPTVMSDHPLEPARNPPPTTVYDYFPVLLIFHPIIALGKHIARKLRRNNDSNGLGGAIMADRNILGRKRKPVMAESNVPLEITLFLSSYLAWLLRRGLIAPAVATAMTNGIASLQDTMANLDRIRNTPIPFAYQAHLRMSLWLYLFFLPFSIYDAFEYLTIPATAFAAFLLLGFLEIGQEIEDPFGYDENDLDIDRFCLTIERELHEIAAHPAPDPESYIFGQWNQPFAPADRRNAKEMTDDSAVAEEYYGNGREQGMATIRRTLLKSWREVSDHTVHHKHK